MMRVERAALLAILILSPLPRAGASEWWMAIWQLLVVFTTACLLVRLWHGELVPTPMPGWRLFTIVGLLMVLALVPWPQTLLRRLMPATVLEVVGPRPSSLSVHPFGTWTQAVWWWMGAALAWVVTQVAARRGQIVFFVHAAIGIGVVVALVGLGQRSPELSARWHLPPAIAQDGVTSLFADRNHFAAYLATLLPITAAVAMAAVRQSARWVVGLGALVLATALFSSGSRGGTLAAGIGLVGLGGMVARRRLVGWPGIVVACGVAAIVASWLPQFVVWERFQQMGGVQGLALRNWREAWLIVRDAPWMGIGVGTFEWVFPLYRQDATGLRFTFNQADSTWLQWLVEFGVVGFVVLLAALWRWVRGVTKITLGAERRLTLVWMGMVAGLGALAVHGLVGVPTSSAAVWLLGWLVIGLVTSLSRLLASPSSEKEMASVSASSNRWLMAGVMAGLLMVSGWLGLRLTAAYAARDQGSGASLQDAVPRLALAHRLMPGHLDYRLNLAHALRVEGQPRAALDLLRDGVRFSPTSAKLWIEIAKTEEALEEDASGAYREALRRDPMNPRGHLALGRYLARHAHDDAQRQAALEVLKRAAALSNQVLEEALEVVYAMTQNPAACVAITPDGAQEQFQLAVFLSRQPNGWPEAKTAYQRAMALSQAIPAKYLQIGIVLAQEFMNYEAFADGAALLRELIERYPYEARLQQMLRRCLVRLGAQTD